ncbi:MAG: hypothetical protein HQL30_09215 [Candidatus Omnitrophica bacterium]|nr:hypothetical protein [Candidatus Omnitrophota bacterium]
MKIMFKPLVMFVMVALWPSICIPEEELPDNPEDIDTILATAPDKISEVEFYRYEDEIIRGFSGSAGYLLEEEEIVWILKAEAALRSKGIELKESRNRHFVIAHSYLNLRMFDKALAEFKGIKDREGEELAEWLIDNHGIKNGPVKIREYPGEIPCSASETAKTEDGRYKYAAYLKGPVYRYDKDQNTHALIYMPEDKYNWCEGLAVAGGGLAMTLRENADELVFNNENSSIVQERVSQY